MGERTQHTYPYRRLCGLLRKWRKDAALTERALTLQLRKPHSYVYKTEIGDRRIDPLEFIAWCRACKRARTRSLSEVERR
jgi:hypothetical protein